MAGRGPAGEGRGHRTKAEKQVTVIGADERPSDVPELVGDFCPATLAWWKTWREAPHAVLFTSTDWQRLIMLAPLVDGYMLSPSKDILSEIRLNESLLGATVVDRLRGKVEVKHEAPKAPAGVNDELEQKRRDREANLA
jgi:hypothetical protein